VAVAFIFDCLCFLCRHILTGIIKTPGNWWLMYVCTAKIIWSGPVIFRPENGPKQTLKLCLQFIFHNQLTLKRYFIPVCNCNLLTLQWVLFCTNVFEKNRKREIIEIYYVSCRFRRSDLLIFHPVVHFHLVHLCQTCQCLWISLNHLYPGHDGKLQPHRVNILPYRL